MLTILTTPKSTMGKAGMDFNNALLNWNCLEPHPQVLVFNCDDEKFVTERGATHIDGVRSTDMGIPYMDDMLRIGQQMAYYDAIMLTSDHLLFLPGLMEAVYRVTKRFDNFLAIGQRYDADIQRLIDFTSSSWEQELESYRKKGHLHGPSAKDYMIMSKGFPLEIPPFIIGRPWYDTWLVVASLKAGIPVVDLSRTVTAIHPNHDYSQIPGNPKANHGNPGELYNAQLAVGCSGKGHITTSTWIDDFDVGIRKRGPDENNDVLYKPVEDVSMNYAEPSIAAKQRAIVDRQLADMCSGKPPKHFDVYGKILQRIKGMVNSKRFSLVDAGCGSAYYYEISEHYVPGWLRYTGLDYNQGMLNMASKYYPEISLRKADLRTMGLQPKSFDIVLSGAVIMHIQEWEKAVVELANAAKRFLILHRTWVHTDNTPTSGKYKETYDVKAWFGTINEKELITLVSNQGFHLIMDQLSGEADHVKTYVFERTKI